MGIPLNLAPQVDASRERDRRVGGLRLPAGWACDSESVERWRQCTAAGWAGVQLGNPMALGGNPAGARVTEMTMSPLSLLARAAREETMRPTPASMGVAIEVRPQRSNVRL